MTPDIGELLPIPGTLAVDDSFYVPVNIRYGVGEIKEDCFVKDTTCFMFFRLWKSVCEKVQATKTFQLSHKHGSKENIENLRT